MFALLRGRQPFGPRVVVSPMDSAFGAEGSEGSKGSKGSKGGGIACGDEYEVSVTY